jgi:hypothetical protein
MVLWRELFKAPTSNLRLVLKAKIVKAAEKRTDTDLLYWSSVTEFKQPKRLVALKVDTDMVHRWVKAFPQRLMHLLPVRSTFCS